MFPRKSHAIVAAFLTALLLATMLAPARLTAQEAAPLSVLTNAQQVLALGIEGARREPHPVHLQAVVTFPAIRRPWFYVQDSTAGILVVCTNESRQPLAGQLIDVVGTAGAGLQAPHVFYADYRVIGTAPLPTPLRADPSRLVVGESFGQWVYLEGNVLDYLIHPDQFSLLLQEGDHRFVVNIRRTEPFDFPTNWLGGRLAVQGVCWTEARADGVPISFRIHTPGTNTITVLREGPTNLFDLPLRSISSLASELGVRQQRVRIAGNVTLLLPDDSLFLRDDTGAIQARLLSPISTPVHLFSVNADTLFRNNPASSWGSFARARPHIEPLKPGDRVEVIGTPSASGVGLVLSDAEYRRLGSGDPPSPIAISEMDMLRGLHEDDLITWRGRLIDRETHRTSDKVEDLLVLRNGEVTVRALCAGEHNRAPPSLPQNAEVQVTGVRSSIMEEGKDFPTFRLFLRGPEDIRVLARPPPWESWKIGRILILGGALGLGSLAWIGFLRQQVRRRTAELGLANTRLLAEVEERKRAQGELSRTLATEKELNQLKSQFISMVSHEFRTPLGVILASADLLSNYLDTLTPEERAEQIADIKQSTCHMADLMEDVLVLGRVESGKMGYHPHAFDLQEFCERLIDEMLSATNRRCPLPLTTEDIATPSRGDETLLRHIFHNLLANGVKYSDAGRPVRLMVQRAGEDAMFTVSDQGIGIPTEDQKYIFEAFYRGKNASSRPGSGLGLVVVKRCVELHGGTIQLQSAENVGTTVIVRLPLFRPAGQTEMIQRPDNTPALNSHE